MEIDLELECGLDVEFTPEWARERTKRTKILWCLQNGPNQTPLDGMLKRHITNRPIFLDKDSIL